MQMMGLVSKMFPVMIGDQTAESDGTVTYSHYFASGCHPNLNGVNELVVKSVEAKLTQHLERQGLGTPMLNGISPKDIVGKVLENQGYFVEGPAVTAFGDVEVKVREMMTTSKNGVAKEK